MVFLDYVEEELGTCKDTAEVPPYPQGAARVDHSPKIPFGLKGEKQSKLHLFEHDQLKGLPDLQSGKLHALPSGKHLHMERSSFFHGKNSYFMIFLWPVSIANRAMTSTSNNPAAVQTSRATVAIIKPARLDISKKISEY